MAKWAYITMKRAGVSSSVEACEAIADYCLCDMSRVSKEVEKLIACGKESMITKTDVDGLVYKDADFRVYQMTGAVARRDYSAFAEIYSDLLGKGYDCNALIASLINYFKTLLTVSASTKGDRQLLAELKTTEYVLGKNRQQARAVGEERLVKFINSLYILASDLKSGKITADGALFAAVAHIFFD